jgi:hypothetical protein
VVNIFFPVEQEVERISHHRTPKANSKRTSATFPSRWINVLDRNSEEGRIRNILRAGVPMPSEKENSADGPLVRLAARKRKDP